MAKVRIKHRGLISEGNMFHWDNPQQWDNQIKALRGKRFSIIIEEEHKPVTTSQHGYYRGGILPFLTTQEAFVGWEEDEIHDRHFASLFLAYKKVIHHKDESVTEKPCVRSTASLSTNEMAEFITKVIVWCAAEGIEIPDSKDFYIQKYREVHEK